MVQPLGFVDPLHPKHVCRLHKALYGLKQAPRAWFQRLTSFYLVKASFIANWAGFLDDRRSTSGACIFLGPNILTWTAKKQSIVSRSSSEAEYRALATTVAELQWFRYLFRELGVPLRTPPCVFVDNISALHMAANPVFHARTRHIEIDYHFVRELLACGVLRTRHVSSQHQLADIFTKSLSRERFSFLSGKLNLHLVPFRLRGGEENDNQAKNPTISNRASNHKGAGAGVVIVSPDGTLLEQAITLGFFASNNKAKYEALLAGLRLAKELSIKRLAIYSHSQLIMNQASGEYMAKHPRMVQYLDKVQGILKEFLTFTIQQVLWAGNTNADALASLGLVLDTQFRRSIPVEHLDRPSIEEIEPIDSMQIDEDPSFNRKPRDITCKTTISFTYHTPALISLA
ncbi:unnamed protein product [Prunus armeniaca]